MEDFFIYADIIYILFGYFLLTFISLLFEGRIMKSLLRYLAVFCIIFSTPALAYTECTSTVAKMYSGDGGYIWFYFANGGSAYIRNSNPDFNMLVAFGMTALAGARMVTIRYLANDVVCSSVERSNVVGIFLK